MERIRKIMPKIISLVLILNFITLSIPIDVFASNNLKSKPKILTTKSNNFSFDWQKNLSILDNLDTTVRENGSDEVFLTWDTEKDSQGSTLDTGTFELTYNIDDKKAAKLIFEKKNDAMDVSYYINDFSSTNSNIKNNQNGYSNAVTTESGYQVYKPEEGKYIYPTVTTYPPVNNNFKIWYEKSEDEEVETAKQVKFTISKGNGFSFKYRNNTVKFKWSTDGKIYFSTNGVRQGNIYEFKLELTNGTTSVNETLQIFNGINTSSLKVTPKANNGQNIIDQTSRPISEYPGDDTEIEVEFEMPKFWDSTKNSYEFVDGDETRPENSSVTQVVLNLNHSDNDQKLQITINDIYEGFVANGTSKSSSNSNSQEKDLNASVASSNSATVEAKRIDNSTKINLKIKNLDAGIIYNPSTISLARPSDPKFLTNSLDIQIGKFYTFPKFSVISFGSTEFYIKLDPFKGYNGYYTINSGDTNATLNKWAVYEEKTYGEDDILIPINLNAINKQTKFFSIDFSLTPPDDTTVSNNQTFKSQILKYTPSDSDVVLGTPANLKVNGKEAIDLSAIYNPITNRNELNLEFRWDMSYKDVLSKLISNNSNNPIEVFYTFYKSDSSNDENLKEFIKIKITVSKSGEELSFQITEVGDKNQIKSSKIEEKVVIADNQRKVVIVPIVELNIPVSPKDNPVEDFIYPSVNFVNLKGEYSIGNDKITTSASLPVNITINDVLKVNIPQPQDVKVENVNSTSFDTTFRTIKWESENDILYDYNNKVLEKVGLSLKEDSIKYDFYISQDKALIDNLIQNNDVNQKIKTIDYENQPMGNFELNTENRDWLRNKNILKITNVLQNTNSGERQTISFKNFDKNQIYYIVIKAFVTPYQGQVKKEEYMEQSAYSTIINLTTLIEDQGPNESEKNPSSPKNFTAGDTGVSYTNLFWDVASQVSQNSDLEYQFIRIKGQQLNESFLEQRKSFEETWNSISNSSKFGFKTNGSKLQKYTSSSNSFTDALKDEFEYINYSGSKRHILDKTLSPNQIYFYYIRTVRVVDGKDEAYSTWIPLSVTTTNIEAPKNLKIEPSKINNKTTEIAITFDLPRLNINEFKDKYTLHYSIKKDSGSWSDDITIPFNDATFEQNSDGTTKVTYVIKNLEHGSLYTIRVRLYSLELKVYSNYSNEVTHKTDVDQAQNEYDQTIKDWQESFKSLLESFKNQEYWLIENSFTTTTVLYRPGYIQNIINNTIDSNIHLASGQDGVNKTYYIPATEFKKAFESNKGFKITFKDADIIISPKTIDLNENNSIKSVLSAINENIIKDYFIKVSVNFVEGNFSINGNTNISPQATVSINLVGTNKLISEWDNYLLTLLNNLVEESFETKIIEYIKQLVLNNKTSIEILQAINNRFESLKEDFFKKVISQINSITKRTYPLETLDNSIIFAYPADSNISVTGYILEAYSWNSISVKNYGNKKAIYANKTGTYILAGSKLIITGIDNIQNGSLITQIIIKYSLEDYLGKGSSINLKANITRNSAIGIAARISGATRNQDPISYFKSKGVTISNRNLDSNATSQESIFLLMKAYEAKTNTKLETIKIKNYNLTSNIRGINSAYKKAIQVAFDTGIYTNPNFSPNGVMTVEEFLQSLAKIIIKVGL